jgi:uncharacterized protein (TIGR03546 family)
MLLLPKPIRKVLAVFRGDVAPALVLISVSLGFWFGLTPGWYGLHVALLVLALVLNIHIGLFLITAALGKALSLAAAPVWYHLGKLAQEQLAPVFGLFAALPVVGLTDFSRFAVAGAVIAGPVLGVLGGLALARAVRTFRRTWLKLEENSPALQQWQANRWVRLLDRLLIGKRTVDARAALTRRPRFVRWPGVVLAVLVLAAATGGAHTLRGERLTTLAADALTQANGAQVDLERLDLDVLRGRVSVTGVQVTDPAAPARNRLAVAELTADASLWHLLTGRLVMHDVRVAGVEFEALRESPGRVVAAAAPAPPAADESALPAELGLAGLDAQRLDSYFGTAQQIRDWLERVRPWLPAAEDEYQPPPPTEPPHRYLEYLTARAAVPPTPRVIVRQVELVDVATGVAQVGRGRVSCANLSDAPRAAGQPIRISIKSLEQPTQIDLTLHYDRPEGGATIVAEVGEVDLQQLQASLRPENRAVFEAGTAAAAVAGRADRKTIDLTIAVRTQNMRVRATSGGLFDLDPSITAEALKVLESVQTNLRVVGALTRPRLVFDIPSLTQEFRQALLAAGQTELARQLDAAIGDKLPAGLPAPGDALRDPAAAAKEALDAVLSGARPTTSPAENDKEKSDESQAADKKEGERDPLSGLREKLREKRKR